MRVLINVLVLTSFVFFCCSCKTNKLNTGGSQRVLTDTLPDSSRLSSYKGDTVGYINYLVKNQAKYIGKPLSELLKDIDMPINTFYYSANHSNRYKVTNLILETKPFGASPRIVNGENRDMEIGIGWQTFVYSDSIKAITTVNGPPDYYKWSKRAEEYFGKQIVGSLWLRGYLKK